MRQNATGNSSSQIISALALVVTFSLACGCGVEGSEMLLEEDLEGKAELWVSDLTVGETGTYEMYKQYGATFAVDIPEGQHAYSLMMKKDGFLNSNRSIRVTWATEGNEQDLSMADDELCFETFLDSGCSNHGDMLEGQYLGIFEGPTRLKIRLEIMSSHVSWGFEMRVAEQQVLPEKARGMLVIGWRARRLDQDQHDVRFFGDQVPWTIEKGDEFTLDRAAPLHRDDFPSTWRGDQFFGYVAPNTRLKATDSCEEKWITLRNDLETSEPLDTIIHYDAYFCEVEVQGAAQETEQ